MARQWEFVSDMNGDGFVTISDVWAWVGWLFFYPGDYIIYRILRDSPELARFLEITPANYGGVLSLFLSFLSWLVLFAIFGAIGEAVNSRKKEAAQEKSIEVPRWDELTGARDIAYKECPECAMFNSGDATRCSCGYDFQSKSGEKKASQDS